MRERENLSWKSWRGISVNSLPAPVPPCLLLLHWMALFSLFYLTQSSGPPPLLPTRLIHDTQCKRPRKYQKGISVGVWGPIDPNSIKKKVCLMLSRDESETSKQYQNKQQQQQQQTKIKKGGKTFFFCCPYYYYNSMMGEQRKHIKRPPPFFIIFFIGLFFFFSKRETSSGNFLFSRILNRNSWKKKNKYRAHHLLNWFDILSLLFCFFLFNQFFISLASFIF